jgi:hypothetical protein
MAGRSHIWENLVAVRVAVTNFERGKWEVVGEKVIGLRRRPLKVGKPSEKWDCTTKTWFCVGIESCVVGEVGTLDVRSVGGEDASFLFGFVEAGGSR